MPSSVYPLTRRKGGGAGGGGCLGEWSAEKVAATLDRKQESEGSVAREVKGRAQRLVRLWLQSFRAARCLTIAPCLCALGVRVCGYVCACVRARKRERDSMARRTDAGRTALER